MKNLTRIFSISILFIIILALSVADAVNAVGEIHTITVGGDPNTLAYDSGKGEIYMTLFNTNLGYDTVSVISDSSNTVVANLNLGNNLHLGWIVYDSAKGEIYVTNPSGTVFVISDSSNIVVANLTLGGPNPGDAPNMVAYDSAKGEIFVTNPNVGLLYGSPYVISNGTVSVISDNSNTVIANLNLEGTNPEAIAYDSGKGEIFVSEDNPNNGGQVSVISDSNNVVVATVPIGFNPTGMVYNPNKGEIYATNPNGTLAVISDKTNTVVANLTLKGTSPDVIAYDSGNDEIFATNYAPNFNSNTVSVISDSSNSVVANLTVGNLPSDIAYDSAKGEVFVANSLSDTVSVIPNASDASSSPSPTIPEFSTTAIILLLVLGLVTICAVALVVKKATRTNHDSR